MAIEPEYQDERNSILRCLVEDVNGFVYAGDRLTAVVDTVKWLKENPESAKFLLGLK